MPHAARTGNVNAFASRTLGRPDARRCDLVRCSRELPVVESPSHLSKGPPAPAFGRQGDARQRLSPMTKVSYPTFPGPRHRALR